MAVMDRMRDRLRGQRPVGAAQEMMPEQEDRMPMGGQIPDIGYGGARGSKRIPMTGGMSEGDLEMLATPRSAEAEDARRLGERMGAESIMAMAGMSPIRQSEMAEGSRLMNPERLNQATQTLLRYQGAKSSINKRVIRSQQWWKLKNWQEIYENRGVRASTKHPSNTGWLWNCIVGKHADAIDSYPEPIILPRMEDDKAEANRLSKIVPVVMEMNDFEETYNDCSWQKMQEGTGVYGVFWNNRKMNGMGDIDINQVNILKKDLEQAYPELEGHLNTTKITLAEYKTDDKIDLSDKAAVIDWYYKKREGEREILHYCKYVNETCLYSSEEKGLDSGYYEDGQYPFVLDALFPVEGSPAGYGYIDIAKDTQSDIDTLSQAMVQNAAMRATPRYFIRKDGSINEEEFADWSKPFVHVSGQLGQDSQVPVVVNQMGNDAHNMLQQKIDEIKFITGNTDVNNGGVPAGVTAARTADGAARTAQRRRIGHTGRS